jgi:hypothetical protein
MSMPTLLDDVPEATAWVEHTKAEYAGGGIFAKLRGAVLWTNDVDADGNLLVEADPAVVAAEINARGQPVFAGHDPGFPLGKAVAARVFATPGGRTFLGAVVGFYDQNGVRSFSALGIDPAAEAELPKYLADPRPDYPLVLGADPREVEEQWFQDLTQNPPFPVHRVGLSNNAADPANELIRVGLQYAILVWNPFVTTLASEAAKKIFAGIHGWLRRLLEKMQSRRNPVLVLQSQHADCPVSFIFRGKDIASLYAAHEALPLAAAQAAKLAIAFQGRGIAVSSIVYEFAPKIPKWFPAYVQLTDGRLISDTITLVAIEQLSLNVSIGLVLGDVPSSGKQ